MFVQHKIDQAKNRIRLGYELKMAQRAGLDFYSAGVHYEKAAFALRSMHREIEACRTLMKSVVSFEKEVSALAPLIRVSEIEHGVIGEDPKLDRLIKSLQRASLNAYFADEDERGRGLRELIENIRNVPGIVEIIPVLARK